MKNKKLSLSLDAFYHLKVQQCAFAAGAPPRIPLEELSTLPRPPIVGFIEPFCGGMKQDGKRRDGREGRGRERKGKAGREGRYGPGKERKAGKEGEAVKSKDRERIPGSCLYRLI